MPYPPPPPTWHPVQDGTYATGAAALTGGLTAISAASAGAVKAAIAVNAIASFFILDSSRSSARTRPRDTAQNAPIRNPATVTGSTQEGVNGEDTGPPNNLVLL